MEIERMETLCVYSLDRPAGVVIGKQGAEIQAVREELQAKTRKRVLSYPEIKNLMQKHR